MNSKERPILFSTEMVRALLDGHKTQTRRLIKNNRQGFAPADSLWNQPLNIKSHVKYCPYGKIGDKLWVREKIYCFDGHELPKQEPPDFDGNLTNYGCEFASVASVDLKPTKIISPIHMPRWCCGIELILTEVSIERVGDISWLDAASEGITITETAGIGKRYHYGNSGAKFYDPGDAFVTLWDSINTTSGTRFCDNPWVWVLKFEVFEVARDA